jgi:hypothetical protein
MTSETTSQRKVSAQASFKPNRIAQWELMNQIHYLQREKLQKVKLQVKLLQVKTNPLCAYNKASSQL